MYLEGLSWVPLATRFSSVCGFGLNRWAMPDNARWTQIKVSQGPRRALTLLACCRKGSHRLAWAVKPRGHARDPGSNLKPIAARCDSNDGWVSPRLTSSTYVWGDSSCWAESTFVWAALMSQPIIVNESSADSGSVISLQYHHECDCHLYYWQKRGLTRHSMLNSVCSLRSRRQESYSWSSSLIIRTPKLFRAGINLTVVEVS